jgi:hypothetical protein
MVVLHTTCIHTCVHMEPGHDHRPKRVSKYASFVLDACLLPLLLLGPLCSPHAKHALPTRNTKLLGACLCIQAYRERSFSGLSGWWATIPHLKFGVAQVVLLACAVHPSRQHRLLQLFQGVATARAVCALDISGGAQSHLLIRHCRGACSAHTHAAATQRSR